MKAIYRLLLLLVFLLLFISCSQKNEQVNEIILVKVGDKTISVDEFIRRAEYTIRPVWCRNDDYIARKVVLNSLIAEKLLAIEAGLPEEIKENEGISLYLEGRKEQAMRQIHFHEVAKKQVDLTNMDMPTYHKMAARTYDVTIIPINDDNLAQTIKGDLASQKTNFEALAEEFSYAVNNELKEQKITFESAVDDAIFKALFMQETEDEQVIGPLKIEKGRYALIKINGWVWSPIVTETKAAQIEKDLQDKITDVVAKDIYVDWIAETMKGHQFKFNAATLEKYINIIGPEYFKSSKDKEEAFNKKFWNKDDDKMVRENPFEQLDNIMNDPLLTYNEESWTVARFEKELKKHPLVFRNKKMPQDQFVPEFRLAVADLIRDIAITKDAYDRKYDRDPRVIRNSSMWQDNILSLYQKEKILEKISGEDIKPIQLVGKYLDPVVRELQIKYDKQVFIDTDAFEKINLTSVDMFVIQRNMPFPVVVPQFPILTTLNKLNYGQKM